MDKVNVIGQAITLLQVNRIDLSHMTKERCILKDSLKGENIALRERLAWMRAELRVKLVILLNSP